MASKLKEELINPKNIERYARYLQWKGEKMGFLYCTEKERRALKSS
jgi:hypothetical protein